MELHFEQAVPSGIVTMVEAFFSSMRLQEILDEMLPYDEEQCKLTPGQRLTALMLCVFGGREALYRVEKFYQGHNLERLFGPGVLAKDFNDDALGRALDKLSAADPKRVFSTLAFHALTVQEIPWEAVHADTTSVSLYGEYEGYDAPQFLKLLQGYSKDGHPELKQLMIGLATTRDGIPLFAEVMDGNTSDKVWNLRLVRELSRHLPAERLRQMLYVADSALVTKTNLAALAEQGYRFVSRLPATFREADEVRDAAFAADAWSDVGALSPEKNAAHYKLWETSRSIDGRDYRLVVVHSTSLDRRKQKQLDALIGKEAKAFEKAAADAATVRYNCREDAETAFRRFVQPDYWQLDHTVEEVEERRYGHRGRPRKNEQPTVERYFRLVITPARRKEDAIALLRARLSAFVLISNDPRRTTLEFLREYKEQMSVEQGFRFIKEPRHIAPVFLKRPDRIEAFAYVQAIALLVYTLIQKKIRDALATAKRPLQVSWRGEMRTPTAQIVLDMMERIQTITARIDSKRYKVYTTLSDEQRYILELLGLDPLIFASPAPT